MDNADKIFNQMSLDIYEKEKDFEFKSLVKDDIKITYFDIKTDDTHFNKMKGEYITFEVLKNFTEDEILTKFLREAVLKLMMKLDLGLKKIKIFVVGMGNPYITCDSLGNEVIKKIIPTGYILFSNDEINLKEKINHICCFNPSVLGNTGIESSSVVESLINKISPDLIVYIDSLITDSAGRLTKSIQLSNTPLSFDGKIIPLNNNIKTLSIGFPSVINIEDDKYTSKDIDLKIERFSNIIADSLNYAFNPEIYL